MLDQLLETKQARQRKPVGTAVSVVLHVLVIAAAIPLTRRAASALEKPPAIVVRVPLPAEAPPPTRVKTLPLAVAPAPSPLGSQRVELVRDIPLDIPAVNLDAATTDARDWTGTGVSGGTHTGTGSAPVQAAANDVFREGEVEKVAAALPGSPSPSYPEQLKSAGVEGEALVQFVVDTLGRAEPGSFRVLRTSHDAFAQAVRSTLPRMRFLPAEVGGVKVRMMVQQSFGFTLAR